MSMPSQQNQLKYLPSHPHTNLQNASQQFTALKTVQSQHQAADIKAQAEQLLGSLCQSDNHSELLLCFKLMQQKLSENK